MTTPTISISFEQAGRHMTNAIYVAAHLGQTADIAIDPGLKHSLRKRAEDAQNRADDLGKKLRGLS